MHIGFTGTRQGMTELQFEKLAEILMQLLTEEPTIFHYGLCIGSDCEAAECAYELGYRIVAHPGYLPKNPLWKGSRGSVSHNDEILPEKPFLDRDRDIVDASIILIGTPAQKQEQRRSGTWATIRYGKKQDKIVIIIFPDGSIDVC